MAVTQACSVLKSKLLSPHVQCSPFLESKEVTRVYNTGSSSLDKCSNTVSATHKVPLNGQPTIKNWQEYQFGHFVTNRQTKPLVKNVPLYGRYRSGTWLQSSEDHLEM